MKINNQEVAICFVSNYGYLQHFYAALGSFLRTNAGQHSIFLFNEDLSESTFLQINSFVQKISPHSFVADMKLETSRLDHFTGYWEKLGKQVFHRLLIPDELPQSYKYALYLDADIIFRKQLDVENLPIADFAICAVKDSISEILAPKRGLLNYFNAGIMFLNLSRWRDMQALELLLKHQPKKTLFAEQELLNEVFANQWFELPREYNYAANHLRIKGFKYLGRTGEDPVIVHYMGGIKPWIFWVRGSSLYWRNIWKTPYRWQVLFVPKTIFTSGMHIIFKTRI